MIIKQENFQERAVRTIKLEASTDFPTGTSYNTGNLPAGAIVLDVNVIVVTAFNGGGTNAINIGDQDSATSMGSALNIGSLAKVAGTSPVRKVEAGVNNEVIIVPTFSSQPTVGEAYVVIEFILPNRALGVYK